MVATLLVVFVPQKCGEICAGVPRDCPLAETLQNLDSVGRWAASLNFITFFSCLASELVYFRREARLGLRRCRRPCSDAAESRASLPTPFV